MKIMKLLLIFIWLNVAFARYHYISESTIGAQYNVYQSGTTDLQSLMNQCDQLGNDCLSFDTIGYLKSTNDPANISPFPYTSIFVKSGGATPIPLPNLFPLPQQYSHGSSLFMVSNNFTFSPNIQSKILNKAIKRYTDIIFNQDIEDDLDAPLASMQIYVSNTSEELQLGTDESYSLSVEQNSCVLKADTVFGAMRGLETFAQLVVFNYTSGMYQIQRGPWIISDFPKFQHRGLMIDTSRHFIPIALIKGVIDSLSYAKLNTLHLHLVDAQSFPVECKAFPNLWMGSWTEQERYTQASLKKLVEYAKDRGVRLIPEFDGPGHMFAWGIGYPEILPEGYEQSDGCYSVCPVNPCDVPADASNPKVYEILDALIKEMTGGQPRSGIFIDDFIHLGGDEVEYACWNESESINNYLTEHNMTLQGLYEYYITQAHNIAFKYGRTPINWNDVFSILGFKTDPRVVYHAWWGWPDAVDTVVNDIVSAGYRCIVSLAPQVYLPASNWTEYYTYDPLFMVDSQYYDLVIGAETCAWGEQKDSSNLMQNIWPKTAAFAERMWNYELVNEPNSVDLAVTRMQYFKCMLTQRGVQVAPLYSPGPGTTPGPLQPGSCYQQ